MKNDLNSAMAARFLAECGRDFHQRGWVLGTSGNFSTVINRAPLELLITASGMDKGQLNEERFVTLNAEGQILAGAGKPSDETKLHVTLVRERGAQAVLHTHSVWATAMSEACAAERGIRLAGWEMLKGLANVRTHEHEEWLPILDNSQDMSTLALELADVLRAHPTAHGFLLRGHGLYTWGASLSEARRHVEIFEFLLELTGRLQFAGVARPKTSSQSS